MCRKFSSLKGAVLVVDTVASNLRLPRRVRMKRRSPGISALSRRSVGLMDAMSR